MGYKNFHIIDTLLALITSQITRWLFEKVYQCVSSSEPSTILAVTVAAIAFFIGYLLARFALVPFLLSNEWLRRTLVGREYIEGHWVERVYRCGSEGEPDVHQYTCIIAIGYDPSGRKLKVQGRNFTLDGSPHSLFKANFSKFEDMNFEYAYTQEYTRPHALGTEENDRLDGLSRKGVGVLEFMSVDRKIPQSFGGRFSISLANTRNELYYVKGARATAEQKKTMHECEDGEGKVAASTFAPEPATESSP